MTEQDGSAIEQNVHRIVVEFAEDGSSTISMTGVTYMQVFGVAKLLEIQGETMFVNEQIVAQQQQAMKAPKLLVPRPKGVS